MNFENKYPDISKMPFIILSGSSSEIGKAVKSARELAIAHNVFIMTGGTYQEQLDNTLTTKEEEIKYYGAVLFGKKDDVSAITKRFSLYTR